MVRDLQHRRSRRPRRCGEHLALGAVLDVAGEEHATSRRSARRSTSERVVDVDARRGAAGAAPRRRRPPSTARHAAPEHDAARAGVARAPARDARSRGARPRQAVRPELARRELLGEVREPAVVIELRMREREDVERAGSSARGGTARSAARPGRSRRGSRRRRRPSPRRTGSSTTAASPCPTERNVTRSVGSPNRSHIQ